MARGLMLTNPNDADLFGDRNMDFARDKGGRVVMLSGPDRIRHDVLKRFLQTQDDSDEPNTLAIGRKRVGGFEGLYYMAVSRMVDDYRDNQDSDLPDDETILSIRSLRVFSDPTSRTRIIVELVLNMADGSSLEIEHRFEV